MSSTCRAAVPCEEPRRPSIPFSRSPHRCSPTLSSFLLRITTLSFFSTLRLSTTSPSGSQVAQSLPPSRSARSLYSYPPLPPPDLR